MMPGSVCRHLKIAGRLIISRLFHVTSQQPRKSQHIRTARLSVGKARDQFVQCLIRVLGEVDELKSAEPVRNIARFI